MQHGGRAKPLLKAAGKIMSTFGREAFCYFIIYDCLQIDQRYKLTTLQ